MSATTKPAKPAKLTRFKASVYLDEIYEGFLLSNSLVDTQSMDWHSILVENARNPASQSAVAVGKVRGNRVAYGRLPYERINKKPHYSPTNLHDWFRNHFESLILNRAQRVS